MALRRRVSTEEVVRCDILLELVGGGEELKMKVKLIIVNWLHCTGTLLSVGIAALSQGWTLVYN